MADLNSISNVMQYRIIKGIEIIKNQLTEIINEASSETRPDLDLIIDYAKKCQIELAKINSKHNVLGTGIRRFLKYKIVEDNYNGFEVRAFRFWFPFWIQINGTNTHGSVDSAKEAIIRHKTKIFYKG